MSLAFAAIVDKVASHAAAQGVFVRVNQHEPKSAPDSGITAAVWADTIGPVPSGSGLQMTSGLLVLKVRVYTPMLAEPQDQIDPNVIEAVDLLLTAYSGDFTLGDEIRNVDLLGQAGTPLSARAGYLNQDSKLLRIMDITLPLIVNDLWTQSP